LKWLKPFLAPGIITGIAIAVAGIIWGVWSSLGALFGLVSSEFAIGFLERHVGALSHHAVVNLCTACGNWIMVVFFWKEAHITLPFQAELIGKRTAKQEPIPSFTPWIIRFLTKSSPYIDVFFWKLFVPVFGTLMALTIYKHRGLGVSKTGKAVSLVLILIANTLMIQCFGYFWKFVFGRYANNATIIANAAIGIGLAFFLYKAYLQYKRIKK